MFKVTYKLYGRYAKERIFETEKEARGFFFGYCVKNSNVTSSEMKAI